MTDSSTTTASFPYVLWTWYLEYLVYYDPASWVGKAASTFRILAFLAIAPFVLLTLLDVTSYVIARTLGVVDDTKASTSDSDKPESMLKDSNPTILVSDESHQALSESDSGMDPISLREHRGHNTRFNLSRNKPDLEMPKAYFVTPTEDSMKLSGVGVFSPAGSRPSSPTIDRRPKLPMSEQQQGVVRDASWQESLGSSSGESSYVMWETDSSPEDAESALRKRTRPDADSSRTTTAGS
ncbi:hypothetical protein GLOTRDRAFT_127665 [Gloeophyllum trabeum ATCC 11539]|uniref:Uncharacterized protein n=1 Tax=Gloeophyllum trabeum (strain ATCC 11539 / FP-39264 / Madison 617) TaxID=670483 RepID=S7QBH4_GLOTA|nr:uncharacterized protein GLOTRDRAFT_127665 [Gloeophyllum trabeum ATCC 11539]EPQ57306.1 hypothetical protein GLOTRDRAFT_127665 [Gloeophyllum trabeum ATCC 11539]